MSITATAQTNTGAGDKPMLLAVSYLRVSTREQAERGGTEEGFSIPAQREANTRKAAELGVRVVREFVDAGESARSADRDELREMLAFIAATQVSFCIVHKLDRLARNRADDVKIHEALISSGVTLVSATESIDQTPAGMLVHGIMSSIAEFYSRNLATEVTKGLHQKLAQGGTPMRAPVGSLNVRKTDEQGREVRTVEVDPERAPLIRWAFETYAKGETSVTGLLREPPERAAALRSVWVTDAAGLRDQPTRPDLRLLSLFWPRREDDQLHPPRGARAGCGAAGRGLLRLHLDQRGRLSQPRRAPRRRRTTPPTPRRAVRDNLPRSPRGRRRRQRSKTGTHHVN